MSESLTIARPYAEAAFQAARQQNALSSWGDALERLAAVVAQPQVTELIGNPAVKPAELADLVADVAQNLTLEQRNFVHLLADNGRFAVLPDVARLYTGLQHREEGVLDAQVTSAFPLTDAQMAEIRSLLEARHGRRVLLKVDVDPELIGGVSIRIGDAVTDMSVRGKLAQLSAALAH